MYALAVYAAMIPVVFPESFSVDLTGLVDVASDLFNGLVPAFLPIWGIALAFVIIGAIGAYIVGGLKLKR